MSKVLSSNVVKNGAFSGNNENGAFKSAPFSLSTMTNLHFFTREYRTVSLVHQSPNAMLSMPEYMKLHIPSNSIPTVQMARLMRV